MDFKPGSEILIKRSNGIVHAATIIGINGALVQVEWSENGETKGKEVSIREMMELNRQKENTPTTTRPEIPPPVVSALKKPAPVERRSQMPAGRIPRATAMMSNSDPPRAQAPTGGAHGSSAGFRKPTSTREKREPLGVRRSEVPAMARETAPAQPAKMARPTVFGTQNPPPKNSADKNFLHMIEDYRSQIKRVPPSTGPPTNQRIIVAVRKRPMNRKELNKQDVDIITVPSRDHLVLHEPKFKVDLTPYLENSPFRFDYAFDEQADNEQVYRYTAKPLVKSIFEGGMATCFAYGQTGSGKTHTMGGCFVSDNKSTQQVDKGVYYFAAKDIFAMNNSAQYAGEHFIVCASFFEIYSGKVFDLLNGKKLLRIMEGKQQVQVVGLSETKVHSVQDVLSLIQQGNSCRTSGSTTANSNSSRSHAIFQISLYRQAGRDMRLHGRFSLIDLAGNERASDTWKTNDHQGRREAADINMSLLALKECIRALGRRSSHLPFRQSRLTHILKDSFIGEKSRTCMIAMISPGKSSCEYTLNTLRYADRVKELVAGERAMAPTDEDDDELMEDDGVGADNSMANNDLERACAAVQESEERVLEEHLDLISDVEDFLIGLQAARHMADDPNYDAVEYMNKLQEAMAKVGIVTERTQRLPAEIAALHDALVEEERCAREANH
ncbi:kinesin-like protein KIF2A [Galendromus occidentalis]|uniref:Kinesin-like protein n=1 Tax=Galendromus occidentalis TaxID=34638 RepID=A0AAJ7SDD8_9ACAR|nr:kinesin-like protein KIF2A [Galendromus occidentalis]